MSRIALIVMMVLAVAVAPDRLSGQEEATLETADLVPVDQGVADRNVLSTSLRVQFPGLDEPGDFSEVFALPDGEYLRAQGGLYAVFPHSVYALTKEGLEVAGIPAGTRFQIGRLAAPAPAATPAAASRLDLRQHLPPWQPRIRSRQELLRAPERRRLDWAFKQDGVEDAIPGRPRQPRDDDDPDDAAWALPPRDDETRSIATDPELRARRVRSIVLSAADGRRP